MNFLPFFFFIGILDLQVAKSTFAPLTILHNLEDHSYALSDLQVLRQKLPLSKGTYRIVLCCRGKEDFSPSWTKKVFTIRGIFYDINDQDLITTTCSEPYQPSVLYIRDTFIYQIGYEISTIYEDPWLNLIEEATLWEFGTLVHYLLANSGTIGTKHLLRAGRHSHGEPDRCSDLQLGKDYFNEVDFNQLYDKDIQNEILKEFFRYPIPETTDHQDIQTTKQHQQLVPVLLTPIDDFDADALRKTVCSYLNTAPIWKSIAEGAVKRVEEHIRKIIDDVIGEAYIWTGTHGILELLTYEDPGPSTLKMKNVYLNGDNKVPVPQVLFKFILHKGPQHNYVMIIIIHNDFNKDKIKKLCISTNVCLSSGWFVDNEDVLSDQVYCCRPTAAVLNTLQIDLAHPHLLDLTLFRPSKVPPLTFLYNSENNMRLFADTEVVKNVQFSTLYETIFTHVILCCPAETNEEKKFQQDHQIQNVLFIRKVFLIDQSIEDFILNCNDYYDPVVRYDAIGSHYNIGYQIRFDEKTILDYDLHNAKAFPQIIQDVYFISTIFLHFNVVKFHSTATMHTIQAAMHSDDSPLLSCKYFPIGRHLDLFNGINIAKFYFQQNQKSLFQQINISALNHFVQYQIRNLDQYPHPYGYLVPHQLVPIQDYNSNSMMRSTCTSLNVVPVWEKVSEGSMKTVESFIRKVANAIGEVTVVTGTYGMLDLSKHDEQPPSPLFLAKISVPKILYKWVSHSVQIDQNTFFHFSIFIITHNEPVELVNKICLPIICEHFGWEVSSKEGITIGTTYCCWPNEEIFHLLDLQQPKNTRILHLRQVPIQITPDLVTMAYIDVVEILGLTNEPVLSRDAFLQMKQFDNYRIPVFAQTDNNSDKDRHHEEQEKPEEEEDNHQEALEEVKKEDVQKHDHQEEPGEVIKDEDVQMYTHQEEPGEVINEEGAQSYNPDEEPSKTTKNDDAQLHNPLEDKKDEDDQSYNHHEKPEEGIKVQ